MTSDELLAVIPTGDIAVVAALLNNATEPERRAAAKAVSECLRTMMKQYSDVIGTSGQGNLQEQLQAAGLALLGTATLSEMRKAGWRAHLIPGGPEVCAEMLKRRNPEWLAEWADWILEHNPLSWTAVRRLVRDSAIPRPTSEAYTRGMIATAWRPGALALLESDPELLECELWRLFEVEGGGEDSLAARGHTWSAVLCRLSAEGRISRSRLLDCSLEALQRDFDAFRAGWFSRFHEALAPTPAERLERVDHYLALLRSRIPPTVSFALKGLAEVKTGLPGRSLVSAVVPALGARAKGSALMALKLLGRAVKQEPELATAAARVACEALIHEAAEVQAAALALIEACGSRDDLELRDLLASRLSDLAPSQRPRLEAWLGETAKIEPPAPPASPEIDDALLARARAVPSGFATLCGLDAAIAAATSGAPLPPALDLRTLAFPRLEPSAALEPVQTRDELIDLLTSLLETGEPADDLERALDGISRLCDVRDNDHERRTAPVLKRARTLDKKRHLSPWQGYPREDLASLIIAWLTGEVAEPANLSDSPDLASFLGDRTHDLAIRAAGSVALPLLSAPTHSGGWVAPDALVSRLLAWAEAGREPELRDLTVALLRLAPDGREAALAQSQGFAGESGEAVRHALGSEVAEVGTTAPLWAAAARARVPWSDDPLVVARHPGLGPECGAVGTAHVRFSRRVYGDKGQWVSYDPVLAWKPPLPKVVRTATLPKDRLTLLHCAPWSTTNGEEGSAQEIPGRRWAASLWPMKREAWLALGCCRLGDNVDWWGAEWANRVHLEPLLDPDTDLGENGTLLLAIGLGAKEPGEASLSTDILIAAIEDGRLDVASLSTAFIFLLQSGPGRPARWAKTLGEACRVSALHQVVVRNSLERLLGVEAEVQAAAWAAVLALYQELLIETGNAVTLPETRARLQSHKSGKVGQLAKSILGLVPGDVDRHHCLAACLALEGRVARAERWAQRLR